MSARTGAALYSRMKYRVIRYLPTVLAGIASLIPGLGHAAELVVHPQVPQPQLTLNAARLLFTMRLLHWPDGTRVRVFVLPDAEPAHIEFAKQTLDLYPRQLRRVWDRHLFSGSGSVPVEVSSVEEMLQRVAGTPGAVGYLPDGYATDAVKVIHVE